MHEIDSDEQWREHYLDPETAEIGDRVPYSEPENADWGGDLAWSEAEDRLRGRGLYLRDIGFGDGYEVRHIEADEIEEALEWPLRGTGLDPRTIAAEWVAAGYSAYRAINLIGQGFNWHEAWEADQAAAS